MHLGSMIGCFTKCTEVTVFWLLASTPRHGNEGIPVPRAPAYDGVGDPEEARGEHAATCTRGPSSAGTRPSKGAAELGKPFL